VFQYWGNQDLQNHASETWYNADGTAAGLLVLEYVSIRNAHIRSTRFSEKDSRTQTLLLTKESLYGNDENLVTYDYDSWGNISQVNAETMNTSVLYNEFSMPKYVEKTYLEGYFNSDVENEVIPDPQHFSFQWDERNLLVSIKGNFAIDEDRNDDENENENSDSSAEYSIAEKRYEYILDEQKNWTERREIIMMRKGNYLFPSEGLTIRRTIMYNNN
jgi:hypothetical protein